MKKTASMATISFLDMFVCVCVYALSDLRVFIFIFILISVNGDINEPPLCVFSVLTTEGVRERERKSVKRREIRTS